MHTPNKLKGKVALITGAGNGIGAACAKRMYAAGMNLVLVDISTEALDAISSSMDAHRVLVCKASVTDRHKLDEVVTKARAKFGRIDVVFANAGIACEPPRTLRTIDEAIFERIVEVDLLGVWRTVRACLPSIVESGGYVLATASIYAFVNGVANIPYAASKASVEMMMRGLRVELAGTGATAGVLIPGWVQTHIAESALGKHPIAGAMVRFAYPSYLRTPIAPETVAEAVFHGMEKRSRTIVTPKRWAPLSLMRGIMNHFTDRMLEGNTKFRCLLRNLELEAASAHERKDF
jgi:NAD(P)-dependent dehydrogenase (short-subunit alcohol dehydrogenase family)